MYLEERYARVGAQSDPRLEGRCESEITNASSGRTTRQVDHVPDAQMRADFAQLRASGCEESAEQPVPLELLQPSLPALSTTTQPLKDLGQLGWRSSRGTGCSADSSQPLARSCAKS